jgi:hypothetical protein
MKGNLKNEFILNKSKIIVKIYIFFFIYHSKKRGTRLIYNKYS